MSESATQPTRPAVAHDGLALSPSTPLAQDAGGVSSHKTYQSWCECNIPGCNYDDRKFTRRSSATDCGSPQCRQADLSGRFMDDGRADVLPVFPTPMNFMRALAVNTYQFNLARVSAAGVMPSMTYAELQARLNGPLADRGAV